jgi:hypothetical protein
MAIALSFIPPVNTLAMMIRMSSTSPPPLWQVWATIGIGPRRGARRPRGRPRRFPHRPA